MKIEVTDEMAEAFYSTPGTTENRLSSVFSSPSFLAQLREQVEGCVPKLGMCVYGYSATDVREQTLANLATLFGEKK